MSPDCPATQLPRRITMRDIAVKLGIDRSTVSLSLRGHPRISKALRQKVIKAADELGYEPDPMLSALAYYRHTATLKSTTAGLAWLNGLDAVNQVGSPGEVHAYYEGAAAAAKVNGFSLHQLTINPEDPGSVVGTAFRIHNIKGVIIPPQLGALNWKAVNWDKYSVVELGSSRFPFQSVVPDQMRVGMLAFQKAQEMGYRRIGLCTGREGKGSEWRYISGFLMAQSQVPLEEQVPNLILEQTNPIHDRSQLKAWIKATAVEAIFTTVTNARSLLQDIGCQVPKDIALASASVLDCDVDAGINQQSFELGKMAVETLISQLNHNHRGIPKVLSYHTIEPLWVNGNCFPKRR